MKLASPMFSSVIEINDGEVFSLIIENQTLFRGYLEDLYLQHSGEEGKIVLSEENVPVSIEKYVDIQDHFTPFCINTKHMISTIGSALEKRAVNEENFLKTSSLLAAIENYISDLCFDMPLCSECIKLSASSVIKAAQVTVSEDFTSEIEKIISYMSLVCDLTNTKLFIFVNMRSYFSDNEIEDFANEVRRKQFRALLIESSAHSAVSGMGRLTVDNDLCEF